jgi:branched-chain amino acid transport system ATP-binding protein
VSPLLEVADLRAGYGAGDVLDGVALEVDEGGALGVLGRNGAGKTTTVLAVMGTLRRRSGRVALDGRELIAARPHEVARAGLALVPQGRRLFGPLTVEEHLDLAGALCRRAGAWDRAAVLDLFPRLAERLGHRAELLSGGEQQMLAVARALLVNPRVLLLDEPTEGLAPAVVDAIEDALGRVRAEGTAIVLVEQDLTLAFAVAEEVVVLDRGRVAHRASTSEFRRDRARAHALLGVAA